MTPLAPEAHPDQMVEADEVFGLDLRLRIPAFREPSPHTPAIDPHYQFQREALRALLVGFAHGRRVLLSGLHGMGKSTHVEQVAARLNWPCLRLSLDGHLSRVDLLGRDTVMLDEGRPVTRFQEGLLPWALRRPVALILDEYDAGRPDVMFVLQRVLEANGKLTLLDTSEVIAPHSHFRIFATANTVGLGDPGGLYAGTQPMNQAQLDRWDLVVSLEDMSSEAELRMLLARYPACSDGIRLVHLRRMVELAHATRWAFRKGELSTMMTPRTVLSWAENSRLLEDDLGTAFRLSYWNRCDEGDRGVLSELFQRYFDEELVQDESRRES